jgi:hypothetical protein
MEKGCTRHVHAADERGRRRQHVIWRQVRPGGALGKGRRLVIGDLDMRHVDVQFEAVITGSSGLLHPAYFTGYRLAVW